MKYLLFFLVALVPFSTSMALDENGNYAVWGVGKKSCYSYNKARVDNDYDNFSNYIKGFLTAYNIMEPKTYNISGSMSFEKIIEWIDDSCELKQTNSIEQTLLEFIETHYESRLRRSKNSAGR